MNRLTTDTPENGTQNALNFFYAKNGEAMTRYHDGDVKPLSLFNFIRKAANTLANVTSMKISTLSWDLGNIAKMDDYDLLNEVMYDNLTEGIETPEGILAHLYMAGWVCAELRARLKKHEDAEITIESLQKELEEERYRHDRLHDFEVAEAQELAKVKAERDALKEAFLNRA